MSSQATAERNHLSSQQVGRFTAVVAILAIFFDASDTWAGGAVLLLLLALLLWLIRRETTT